MCEPVTIGTFALTATQTALASLAIASAAASIHTGNKAASAQAHAINEQNEVRAKEIAVQKGHELTDNAQRAALERSAMRAAASESGVSLGEGSFMAALQTSAINESNNSGTIIYNEQISQRARNAEAKSAMSGVQKTTGLGAVLKIGSSAALAAYGARGK